MALSVKELPESERPYEKAMMYGINNLSNAELLSIIIKNGTKDENSIQIANRLLNLVDSMEQFTNLEVIDFKQVKGIGTVKAIQLLAVCEIAKRMFVPINNIKKKICGPSDVVDLLRDKMMFEKQEIIKILLLNAKNEVVSIKDVVIGDVSFSNVSLKLILSEPIKMKIGKIILVHNHPSGDPTPSSADVELTINLINAAKIMGIKLIDHIVIGHNKYESVFSRKELADEFF
jgi:UPF0758 protein CBO3003/CLC_2900